MYFLLELPTRLALEEGVTIKTFNNLLLKQNGCNKFDFNFKQ